MKVSLVEMYEEILEEGEVMEAVVEVIKVNIKQQVKVLLLWET
jgi:hypothetical protein